MDIIIEVVELAIVGTSLKGQRKRELIWLHNNGKYTKLTIPSTAQKSLKIIQSGHITLYQIKWLVD